VRPLLPRVYCPESSSWASFGKGNDGDGLLHGEMLKVVSWNLCWNTPDPQRRVAAILCHLQDVFGTEPNRLVVMFQEARLESLQAIEENSWVQRNFILTDSDAPESIYKDIPGKHSS
jgi:hypothetical protein